MLDIEKSLKIISRSQEIPPNDKLDKIVKKYCDDELFEEELYFVSAAMKNNYNDFLKFIDTKKN